jgi:hypothetical protein
MELTAAQRKLAFAVVVLVLAGLGVYLVTTAGHRPGSHPATSQASTGPGRPAAGPGTPAAAPTASQSAPASSAPASSTSSSRSPTPNIYQWLPFTPAGLASASVLTVKFGAAYGTYSYTQSPSAYVATMGKYVTQDLGQQIEAAYATPGVVSQRKSQKQVSTGSASITSLSAFGPSSLTFVVAVTQRVTATKDGGQKTTSYDVTVSGGDTSWQVSDIELAGQGNS